MGPPGSMKTIATISKAVNRIIAARSRDLITEAEAAEALRELGAQWEFIVTPANVVGLGLIPKERIMATTIIPDDDVINVVVPDDARDLTQPSPYAAAVTVKTAVMGGVREFKGWASRIPGADTASSMFKRFTAWLWAKAGFIRRGIDIGGSRTFALWTVTSHTGQSVIFGSVGFVHRSAGWAVGKVVGFISGFLRIFGKPGNNAADWVDARRAQASIRYNSAVTKFTVKAKSLVSSDRLGMRAIAGITRYLVLARLASYFLPAPFGLIARVLLLPVIMDKELRSRLFAKSAQVWERADRSAHLSESMRETAAAAAATAARGAQTAARAAEAGAEAAAVAAEGLADQAAGTRAEKRAQAAAEKADARPVNPATARRAASIGDAALGSTG